MRERERQRAEEERKQEFVCLVSTQSSKTLKPLVIGELKNQDEIPEKIRTALLEPLLLASHLCGDVLLSLLLHLGRALLYLFLIVVNY